MWTAKDARRSRQVTCNLIEAAEDGMISWEELARNCMSYMSESDVAGMARVNGYNELFEDEDEEDDE